MSHVSVYKHRITNIDIFHKVCLKKGTSFVKALTGTKVTGRFYKGQIKSGVAMINLSKWRYPLIIDEQGQIHYDNWGSQRGSMDQFGDLLQDYNMEVVKQNIDTTLWDNISIEKENGDIQMKLTIY